MLICDQEVESCVSGGRSGYSRCWPLPVIRANSLHFTVSVLTDIGESYWTISTIIRFCRLRINASKQVHRPGIPGNSRESATPKIPGGNSRELLNSLRKFPWIWKISNHARNYAPFVQTIFEPHEGTRQIQA